MILCQPRFIDCNKYTTLVEEIDNVRLSVCVRGHRVNGKSLLSSQFCCELETALKKKVVLKNNQLKPDLKWLHKIFGRLKFERLTIFPVLKN